MDDSLYYTTTTQADQGIGPVGMVIYLVVIVLMLVSLWKMFVKAGKPGWAAIVPIYNYIVLLEIVGRPIWWLVLLLIPFVNIIVAIIVANDTSKAFGKGVGTTLLLIFLPFIGYPMLAFGDAKYVGPVATKPAAKA
jgi:hypothetical protein